MEGLIFGILLYFNSRRKFTGVGLLVIELAFSFQVSQLLQDHSYHYFLSNSLSKRCQSVKTVYHRKVW